MKNRLISLGAATACLLLALNSCDKAKVALDSERQKEATNDFVAADNATKDIFTISDEATRRHPGLGKDNAANAILSGCEEITVDSTSAVKTLTIDFGAGCVGNDGRTRIGTIKVSFTGNYHKKNSFAKIDFSNFRQLEGSDTLVFDGGMKLTMMDDWDEQRKVNIRHENLKCTFQKRTWTWNGDRTFTQLTGTKTPETTDDMYSVIGNMSGKKSTGTTYDLTVADALKISPACKWVMGGSLNIVFDGGPQQKLIYGDSNNPVCDDQAQLVLDGTTINFTMK